MDRESYVKALNRAWHYYWEQNTLSSKGYTTWLYMEYGVSLANNENGTDIQFRCDQDRIRFVLEWM